MTMVSGGVGVRFCLFSANEAGIIRLSVVTAGNSEVCLAACLLYTNVCLIFCYVEMFRAISSSWGGYCFVPICVCAYVGASERGLGTTKGQSFDKLQPGTTSTSSFGAFSRIFPHVQYIQHTCVVCDTVCASHGSPTQGLRNRTSFSGFGRTNISGSNNTFFTKT